MKIIGILGDIGSGKSFLAKKLGYPVFNADLEINKIYKENLNCFKKLNKSFPLYIKSFPINKRELSNLILASSKNLKKVGYIVHPYVQKNLKAFLLRNKNKKIVTLDIPLLLENKIEKKNFILIFIKTKKADVFKRLKKRKGFNKRLYDLIKKNQFELSYKEKKSNITIRNNFNKKFLLKEIRRIRKILK
tara:strand:+ start:193 stop:762 length:570 start_codon:yes stop_codon:yes gene_type:complete